MAYVQWKKEDKQTTTVNKAAIVEDHSVSVLKDKDPVEGVKFDQDKARWDLLDYTFVGDAVDVLTFGAKKYGPNSWKKVENGEERYFAALMRHIVAWRKGEAIDSETGKSHLAHALCNLMFIYNFDKEKK